MNLPGLRWRDATADPSTSKAWCVTGGTVSSYRREFAFSDPRRRRERVDGREGLTPETRRERRRVAAAADTPPEARPEVLSESETLRRLMRRKRR